MHTRGFNLSSSDNSGTLCGCAPAAATSPATTTVLCFNLLCAGVLCGAFDFRRAGYSASNLRSVLQIFALVGSPPPVASVLFFSVWWSMQLEGNLGCSAVASVRGQRMSWPRIAAEEFSIFYTAPAPGPGLFSNGFSIFPGLRWSRVFSSFPGCSEPGFF